MFIDYDSTKKIDIIKQYLQYSKKLDMNLDASYLFQGENSDVLATLINNGFKQKIDLIYIDPPFNTNQDFTINEGRNNAISKSIGIVAYSDKMPFFDYLKFMQDRFILLYELLSEIGSIYVHTDLKMGHYLKILLDYIFGIKNFKNDIARIKSNPKNFNRKAYGNNRDMLLFYAKNHKKNIFNNIKDQFSNDDLNIKFNKADQNGRRYNTVPCHAPGKSYGITGRKWKSLFPPEGRHWRTSIDKLNELDKNGLIEWSKTGVPRIKKYADECQGKKIQDTWYYKDPMYPSYPTEKNYSMLDLIIKQSSIENSYVLDCFAGGGTTIIAAQNNSRHWIGIDNSQISINIIKKKLLGIQYRYIKF